MAGHYPDGQLYCDLHGYAPDRPAGPADVLRVNHPGTARDVRGHQRGAHWGRRGSHWGRADR